MSVTLAPGSWRLRAQYKSGHLKVHSATVTIQVQTWMAVSCGWAHTMALQSNDTLWGWGAGGNGQLGLGSKTADRDAPTQIEPGTTWKTVSAGYDFTLAIRSNGTLWAWGDNSDGQLGLGSTAQKDSPTQVDPGTTWKAVSAGYFDTLAVRSDGTLWGWGYNTDGELGLGNTTQYDTPLAGRQPRHLDGGRLRLLLRHGAALRRQPLGSRRQHVR